MKKKVVIEFSEHWIKAVSDRIILDPIEPGTLNIAATLDRIFQKIGQKKNLEVLVALSRNKVTLRRLDLPSRQPSEIQSMLGLHVFRQVPYPKEEIIWGYQNLGFDGVNSTSVLLVIVHREVLRNIFNAFMSLNLLPEAMLISSQGIIHYLHSLVSDKTQIQGSYLILDIDYNYSDLMLVANNNLRSSIVISRGAEHLKSEEEAEKFNSELKQALVIFNNESYRPSLFFLTGAASNTEDLIKDYIEKDFNLRFQYVKNKQGQTIEGIDTVSVSAVLGFSYKKEKQDISFILPEAQIKKEIKLKLKQLLIFGATVTYCFILLGVLALIKINKLESYRDKLDKRVTQLRLSSGKLSEVAEKINIVKKYWNADDSIVSYIYELMRLCPENITLTNFNWEWQKKLSIRGYAQEMPDVSAFLKVLNNSKNFSGVQTRYIRRRKIKDKETVDFELESK
ncbi:MAG: PilN domain-containing protein [Candidatus Omnitrophica bacterium]|nr:PilN domain-containing protein [Candidatus Omnitrophota bacterium]